MINVNLMSLSKPRKGQTVPEIYTLEGTEVGSLHCSCPAMKYRAGQCKHCTLLMEIAALGMSIGLSTMDAAKAAPERQTHQDLLSDDGYLLAECNEIPFDLIPF